MYVVYFGLHAWSFLNITFNVRLSGLKKMEIVFIKDCSLEKFMVSQEGKKKTNYQYLRNSFKKKKKLIILTNLCAGRAQKIVVAESVALNFLQRMSGIATLKKV